MFSRVVIPAHERGLHYVDGSVARVLPPGSHWVRSRPGIELKRLSLLKPKIELPDAELLFGNPLLTGLIDVFRVQDHECGLLFKDDLFEGFLRAGTHGFVKGPAARRVEIIDGRTLEVTHPSRDVLCRLSGASAVMTTIDVADSACGHLFVDGVATQKLSAGSHSFWSFLRKVSVVVVDLREQMLEIHGQELMTADKVSVRMNLTVQYAVVDSGLALATQANFKESVYRALQLALRDQAGAQTLDELLAKKGELGEAVLSRAAPAALAMGVSLRGAGLRDVILPGEMRTIFNQVIEAGKRAEANMISRREETAATRSLLNTAKLLETNPTLMHLKQMESAERIAEKIGSLSVFGGLEGLTSALTTLGRETKAPPKAST